MNRIGCRLIAAVLMLCLLCCSLEAFAEEDPESIFIPLTVGSKGDAVLTLKQRLYEMGYYRKSSFKKTYTADTAEVVRAFQQINGLPETGEVDYATWTLLQSGMALPMPRPTLVPLASPAPTPVPDWPERDPEGFLASDGEYFYENDGEGLWIYLGKNLQVTITRREDSSIPLEWYETEIRTRNGEAFRSVITDPDHPGKKFQYPYVIARQERFVLGFSDDFFGNRMQKKETVGIIIREGMLISGATNRKTGHHLPNLDMMAQYPDGRLEVYECNEFSAEELLAMGARNVLSFGPLLIRNGEINDLVYDYYKSLEPRQALGMISPNHFFLLSVQGRNSGSRGTTLQRVAEMMKEKGVTAALNLDGGNTMALIFRGRMLNKLAVYKNRKFVRTVPSLLGVGMCQEDFSD